MHGNPITVSLHTITLMKYTRLQMDSEGIARTTNKAITTGRSRDCIVDIGIVAICRCPKRCPSANVSVWVGGAHPRSLEEFDESLRETFKLNAS